MRNVILTSLLLLLVASLGQCKSVVYPVPPELLSNYFTVTIDGQPAAVSHAATTYYFLNFELQGSATISITAPSADYWDRGVEVQPWRWNIRPIKQGATISFTIDVPMKLSITRPGDHAAGAEMLFLFANAPESSVPKPGTPGVTYFSAGVYHQNIDVASGANIYLAAGAVIFGAINIWGVHDVTIEGRGTVVYDGPQNPNNDEGWMHRPNWHVIVMDHARRVRIIGITCLVRSRTWMIQMLESRDVTFDNVKVIGGCPGNANQDGIDWLGGGDTIVRDSFFRASDDVFAMYGNWLGYTQEALTAPGPTVDHILIENSVLSTSISNIVRVSWPQKVFDSHNFVMRNSDVIHMGFGGCKIPFGLLEIWDVPGGRGSHSNYKFDDIRLEHWYSLTQLRQQTPSIQDITFQNIWAIENPSLVPSVLEGNVSGVRLDNVRMVGTRATSDAAIPLLVTSGALQAEFFNDQTRTQAAFTYSDGELKPGQPVRFDASGSTLQKGSFATYEWSFGDGTAAQGKTVLHSFPDSEGTLRDHSGRYRVLLTVTDSAGTFDRIYRPVVISDAYSPASRTTNSAPGLQFQYYEGSWSQIPKFETLHPIASGSSSLPELSARKRDENYAFVFEGDLNAPDTGGYSFLLLSNDAGSLEIDSHVVAASPAPEPQVCGSRGNIVRPASGSIGLERGLHHIRISMTHTTGPDGFAIKWEGPQSTLVDIPAAAFFH